MSVHACLVVFCGAQTLPSSTPRSLTDPELILSRWICPLDSFGGRSLSRGLHKCKRQELRYRCRDSSVNGGGLGRPSSTTVEASLLMRVRVRSRKRPLKGFRKFETS